jgi:shikimate kinase
MRGAISHVGANVYLAGASCSGKTTVAPLLARALGYEAVDTDERIVAHASRLNPAAASVPLVFEHAGGAMRRSCGRSRASGIASSRSAAGR